MNDSFSLNSIRQTKGAQTIVSSDSQVAKTSLSFFLSLSHTHTKSHAHALTRTGTHTYTHALTRTHTHTQAHSVSLFPSKDS